MFADVSIHLGAVWVDEASHDLGLVELDEELVSLRGVLHEYSLVNGVDMVRSFFRIATGRTRSQLGFGGPRFDVIDSMTSLHVLFGPDVCERSSYVH